MLGKRQWRKVLAQNRRWQSCVAAGTHPTDSGERSTAKLAGIETVMARCKVCGVRYPA